MMVGRLFLIAPAKVDPDIKDVRVGVVIDGRTHILKISDLETLDADVTTVLEALGVHSERMRELLLDNS